MGIADLGIKGDLQEPHIDCETQDGKVVNLAFSGVYKDLQPLHDDYGCHSLAQQGMRQGKFSVDLLASRLAAGKEPIVRDAATGKFLNDKDVEVATSYSKLDSNTATLEDYKELAHRLDQLHPEKKIGEQLADLGDDKDKIALLVKANKRGKPDDFSAIVMRG